MSNVFALKDLKWDWDERGPQVMIPAVGGRWARTVYVDPAPAYSHDLSLVEKMLALCEEKWKLPTTPPFYILDRDGKGRENGWTSHDSDWNVKTEKDRNVPAPYVLLYGKRIPIMPAMTRYLVSHEYGHCVECHMAFQRYPDEKHDASKKLMEEYGKLRGAPETKYYGPGTWHDSIGEVFANDFRILFCGMEPEFWPHPNYNRPEENPAVRAWWNERKQEFNHEPYKPQAPKPADSPTPAAA